MPSMASYGPGPLAESRDKVSFSQTSNGMPFPPRIYCGFNTHLLLILCFRLQAARSH